MTCQTGLASRLLSLLLLSIAALVPSKASAIVLIDQFDSPVDQEASGNSTGIGYTLAGVGASPYTASFNGGTVPGNGAIGGIRRVATYGANQSITVNSSVPGSEGLMSAAGSAPSSQALWILDGPLTATTSAIAANKPSVSFGSFNGLVAPVLTTTNVNASGLGGANLMLGGDIPRGIVFDGMSGSLTGGATIKLAVLRNNSSQYAYFEMNSSNFSTLPSYLYVPFTGFGAEFVEAYPNTPRFFASSGANLVDIFQDVGAIVMQFSNNNVAGGFNFSVNAIYSHTPEPASMLIWGLFGTVGVIARRKRVVSPVAA